MGRRSWERSFGNVRSFVGNAMGGLRGWNNLASWAVAGTLAYFLWVKPAQQLRKEEEERAALAAASDKYRYIEKRKPIPDPQILVAEYLYFPFHPTVRFELFPNC
ncbi:subtilisin-like protease [Rhynchospora pubera]|uniref:Subtilisin-like protease n=1 Tax=Rhynchospora pubera TaxID=906938 RepID=A0AAV8H005_9POAL|nr:subtilisin-like protease [Rhynchospora pubera]